eukprot:COSAG04_NODE_9333_length_873_cov_1.302326_1_plen_150_part_01
MACADDGAFAAAVPSHSVVGLPALSPTMVSPHAGPAPPRPPPHKASAPQTEGSISSWLVSVGEEVEVGDVFCEIETDKATVEMECQDTCEAPPRPPPRPALGGGGGGPPRGGGGGGAAPGGPAPFGAAPPARGGPRRPRRRPRPRPAAVD